MDKYINLVSNVFVLVANYKTYDNHIGLYFKEKNITIDFKLNKNYYNELFSTFTLSQLRDVLYLLVMFTPNCSNVDILPKITLIIQYIEKDLFTENHITLINENIALRNKYESMQSELNNIKEALDKVFMQMNQ